MKDGEFDLAVHTYRIGDDTRETLLEHYSEEIVDAIIARADYLDSIGASLLSDKELDDLIDSVYPSDPQLSDQDFNHWLNEFDNGQVSFEQLMVDF